MSERTFSEGVRSVTVRHYDVGVRRSVEFSFDGMETMGVEFIVEHHGGLYGTSTQTMALTEEEMGLLIAKLRDLHGQMVSERKKQEEWEAKHSQ